MRGTVARATGVLVVLAVALGLMSTASPSSAIAAPHRVTRHGAAVQTVWKLAKRPKAVRPLGRVVAGPGGNGEVEIRHGSRWSAPMALSVGGEQVDIGAVTCPTASFCGAYSQNISPGTHTVSRDGETYAFAYTGHTWIQSVENPGPFVAISCPAAGFCRAASDGVKRLVFTFSDNRWLSRDIGLFDATLLSCSGVSFCVTMNAEGVARIIGATKLTVAIPAWEAANEVYPYRGSDLYSITSLTCPRDGYCVAVGTLGSRAQRLGPETFYAVLRRGTWSNRIPLPQADGRVVAHAFCTTAQHCEMPLTRTRALISTEPFTLPRHPGHLPAIPGLPRVSQLRLTGTPLLPSLTLTIAAGGGTVTQVLISLYGVFDGGITTTNYVASTDPSVRSADIRVRAGSRPVAFTTPAYSELDLLLKHSASTVTVALTAPVLVWSSATGLSPPNHPEFEANIFNSQDTVLTVMGRLTRSR